LVHRPSSCAPTFPPPPFWLIPSRGFCINYPASYVKMPFMVRLNFFPLYITYSFWDELFFSESPFSLFLYLYPFKELEYSLCQYCNDQRKNLSRFFLAISVLHRSPPPPTQFLSFPHPGPFFFISVSRCCRLIFPLLCVEGESLLFNAVFECLQRNERVLYSH